MHRLRGEDGVGLISSVAGIFVFLAFLLLAAQVLVHLFATSYVNAAAFDAARLASGAGSVSASQARDHGMDVLGSFAGRVSRFDVAVGAEQVTVSVQARSPALLPRLFGQAVGVSSIDRSVTLRRERPQCVDC